MACTETGLKTCDRPAVLTLKPLVRRKRRRRRRRRGKSSLSLVGDSESDRGGREHRLPPGSFMWTMQDTDQQNIPPAYRDNVNRSARTVLTNRQMHVVHFSASGGQKNLKIRQRKTKTCSREATGIPADD